MVAWICRNCCLTRPRPRSKRKRGAIVKWRAQAGATSLRRRICFSPTCRPRISWRSIAAQPSVALELGHETSRCEREEAYYPKINDSWLLHPQSRSEEHTSELQSLRHLVC